jgi:hypothetical protein
VKILLSAPRDVQDRAAAAPVTSFLSLRYRSGLSKLRPGSQLTYYITIIIQCETVRGLAGITKGNATMKRLLLIATAAVLIPAGANVAAAAELPTYNVTGFPITSVQASVVGSGQEQESPPAPTLTVDGMPASPVQISVLTPRKHVIGQLATKPTTESRAQ